MENTKRNAEKNLKHIQVYRKLYNLIRQGAFAPGTRLPSEPALAEQLAVSRMTLRRALALLQEDHLVKNIRGKGNYVCLPAAASNPITVSQLFHPIYTRYLRVETELVFRIEPPSESFTQAWAEIPPPWSSRTDGITEAKRYAPTASAFFPSK